jgi:hypothetical protein
MTDKLAWAQVPAIKCVHPDELRIQGRWPLLHLLPALLIVWLGPSLILFPTHKFHPRENSWEKNRT